MIEGSFFFSFAFSKVYQTLKQEKKLPPNRLSPRANKEGASENGKSATTSCAQNSVGLDSTVTGGSFFFPFA
jgi:hypothetical protein